MVVAVVEEVLVVVMVLVVIVVVVAHQCAIHYLVRDISIGTSSQEFSAPV